MGKTENPRKGIEVTKVTEGYTSSPSLPGFLFAIEVQSFTGAEACHFITCKL